jgi:hypothetical protein
VKGMCEGDVRRGCAKGMCEGDVRRGYKKWMRKGDAKRVCGFESDVEVWRDISLSTKTMPVIAVLTGMK